MLLELSAGMACPDSGWLLRASGPNKVLLTFSLPGVQELPQPHLLSSTPADTRNPHWLPSSQACLSHILNPKWGLGWRIGEGESESDTRGLSVLPLAAPVTHDGTVVGHEQRSQCVGSGKKHKLHHRQDWEMGSHLEEEGEGW